MRDLCLVHLAPYVTSLEPCASCTVSEHRCRRRSPTPVPRCRSLSGSGSRCHRNRTSDLGSAATVYPDQGAAATATAEQGSAVAPELRWTSKN